MTKKIDWNQIIVFLAKTGFVYQTNKNLGGYKNSWDYGPYGTMLKENILKVWKKCFIDNRQTFLMEASHFLNPKTWIISKHIEHFQDTYIDCISCKKRFRIELTSKEDNQTNKPFCLNCKKTKLTKPRAFNLLFETNVGSVTSNKTKIYLRPELAQGIFGNFMSITNSMRVSIPFGIGQIGMVFRNEITTNSFLYKTRVFQIAELEFFVNPVNEEKFFSHYCQKTNEFLTHTLKLNNVKKQEIDSQNLAHYSKKTVDFLYKFNNESYQELCGVANRSTFDLTEHSNNSLRPIYVMNHINNKKIIPSVIEVSMGIDRLFLAIVSKAYIVEILANKKKREVLKLPAELAPFLVAVNSLTKKQIKRAEEIFKKISQNFSCLIMHKHSIGKRYRIQDCIGVKYNITIDFQTNDDLSVSLRDRDTMKQKRVAINNLINHIKI